MMKRFLWLFGLLVLGLLPACGRRGAKLEETSKRLEALATAIDMFQVDKDVYPADLKALGPNPKGWGASSTGYLVHGEKLVDAWGTKFRYSNMTNTFELRSAGPDRQFDTVDDMLYN